MRTDQKSIGTTRHMLLNGGEYEKLNIHNKLSYFIYFSDFGEILDSRLPLKHESVVYAQQRNTHVLHMLKK